ncbi:hypothetical protein AB0B89_25750 [Sphaerisporangium sp. NPDC049002]|uniref:hypothetical protein n=1 Tax=Sphaerisporangium sp. NPDC049002 TaxID=3155392 RepID=UPI0033DC5F5D
MIAPDVTMRLADPHGEDVELRRQGSRVSERRGSRVEVLIDQVDEDVAAVHFELAADRYAADGYSPRPQAASPCVLGTPADDAGYAFAFAAMIGGATGALIQAQALRLWEDDQAARHAEREAIERVDSQVNFYGLLDDHLLLVPDEPAVHAYIDCMDVVSIVDGLATAKGMTPGLLGFDPKREPWRIDLMGRHRLRGLLASADMSRLRSLRIRTWGGTAHLDPVLRFFSATDRLTHLCLWTLVDTLSGLALPALRHLALWETHVDIATLSRSPVVARLATLDLWKVNHPGPFGFPALLGHRRHLAHLERIVVPGHGIPAGTAGRFGDWPQVTFAGHNRREVLALDLDTRGYPLHM